MGPSSVPPGGAPALSDVLLRRALASMSVFTIAMTLPQIWNVWVAHQAAGVSILSWSAYLLSAVLWFGHGLRQRDKNIYLPCIGWIAADTAIIVGAFVHG